MAPPHLLLPNSSAKALIPQQISSSSPISSIDSPTEPSLPASPPQHPVYICNPQLDLSILSSSSSSFSLVPEIIPVPGNNGPRHREKKKQHHGQKRHYNRDGKTDHASEKRSKLVRPHTAREAFADHHREGKACQDKVCCKCVAGFTADCAAICCCPLALLHLAALTFIRLPTAVAWKMLVKLKTRICTKRLPLKDGAEDSPRPKIETPWPYGGSPEAGTTDPSVQVMRFDSQKLWQHFETGNLEFGGLSTKREPF